MSEIIRQHLAKREFAAALKLLPVDGKLAKDAERQNWRGVALAGMGRADEARKHFELAIELAPDEANYRLNLAILLSSSDPTRAELLFKESASLNPNNPTAHLALGQIAASRGDAAHAESLFRTALRAKPELPSSYFGLGHLQIERGQIDDAINTINKGLVLNPRDPDGQLALARAFFARGSRDFARQALSNALALDGSHPGALLIGTRLALNEGRVGEADGLIKRLRRQRPTDPEVISLDADVARAIGDSARAQLALERLLELDPSQLSVILKLAAIVSEKAPLAAADLMAARAPAVSDKRALWVRAVQLAANHDLDHAYRLAKQFAQQEPNDALAWNHVTALAELKRELEQAKMAAERALELDPNLAQAKLVLARAALRYKEPAVALERLNELLSNSSELHLSQRLDALRHKGRAALLLKDASGALESWLAAAALLQLPLPPALPMDPVRFPVATELAEKHPSILFLVGASSELLAGYFDEDPRFFLLRDRMLGEPRRDLLSERARLDQAFSASELLHVRKRYLDRIKRVGSSDQVLVDWLPELDVRAYDVLRAVLPNARFALLERDAGDALIDALAQTIPIAGMGNPTALAKGLKAQRQHFNAIKNSEGPWLVLDFEQWRSDPDAAIKSLAETLALADTQTKLGTAPQFDVGGLPRYLPPGLWRAFDSIMPEALVYCEQN